MIVSWIVNNTLLSNIGGSSSLNYVHVYGVISKSYSVGEIQKPIKFGSSSFCPSSSSPALFPPYCNALCFVVCWFFCVVVCCMCCVCCEFGTVSFLCSRKVITINRKEKKQTKLKNIAQFVVCCIVYIPPCCDSLCW